MHIQCSDKSFSQKIKVELKIILCMYELHYITQYISVLLWGDWPKPQAMRLSLYICYIQVEILFKLQLVQISCMSRSCMSCNLYKLLVRVATCTGFFVQVATCTKSQLVYNIYMYTYISSLYWQSCLFIGLCSNKEDNLNHIYRVNLFF